MPKPPDPDIAFEPPPALRRSADATSGPLFHLVAAAVVVAGVLIAQAAAAEDRISLMRDACFADYQRFCASIRPGGGRIKQCMLDHADELSDTCRTALLSEGGQ